MYIAGFQHPHMFSQFADIGIHIDSIIKVTSEDYNRFEATPTESEESEVTKDEKTLGILFCSLINSIIHLTIN